MRNSKGSVEVRIGIPKEAASDQTRVAATPDTAKKLMKLGYELCIEADAGAQATYFDEQYEAIGVPIVDAKEAWGCDIVIALDPPEPWQLDLMKPDGILISRLNPGIHPDLVDDLAKRGLTSISMDAVPRISRAQSIDARSSMTNLSGYRAVIEAADAFGRQFGGGMTAAGKVNPAKVYVIGVGVAGLSAIGTASSMGADVYATDVRPEVADQVVSMGGTFVEIPVKQQSDDGYAKALSEDEANAANKVYAEQAAKSDIVITTAMVAGRTPPLLLDDEAIAGMKPGSVIVDLGASPDGGNASLSRVNEVVRTPNGVTIIGHTNLPAKLAEQASQLYGQNIVNFFKLTTPDKDGKLVLNEDDEIVRGMTVTLDGAIMWPPPPVSVSAQPAQDLPAKESQQGQREAKAARAADDSAAEQAALKDVKGPGITAQDIAADEMPAWRKWWWKVAAVIVAALLVLFAPEAMQAHFVVFALAVVVGFYVITGVSHSLHTPLMSVTNAISGIIIVGAMLLVGSGNPVVVVLAFIAMVIASINIFGGFLVTHRMLSMFQRSSEE